MHQFQLILVFLLSAAAPLCTGCSSLKAPSWMSNPFVKNSDEDDPLYADTKSAKVDQIRAMASNASGTSPAEQLRISRSLTKRLQSEDDPVLKLEAIRALQEFSTPAAIDGLRMALDDARPRIRIAACKALAEMKSSHSLELLANTIQSDSNLDVRVAATRGLAGFKSQRAMEALAIAIDDSNPALQYTAVQSMRKIHDQDLGENLHTWQQLARKFDRSDASVSVADGSNRSSNGLTASR